MILCMNHYTQHFLQGLFEYAVSNEVQGESAVSALSACYLTAAQQSFALTALYTALKIAVKCSK